MTAASRPPSIVEATDVVAAFALAGVAVAAFELTGNAQDVGAASWLLPDEREFVDTAIEKRQAEFGAGRACARAALAALAGPPAAIGVADRRQPAWPEGFAGAITHTAGYCAAVVASIDRLGGHRIGIDAETVGRVSPNLYRKLFSAAELEWLDAADDAAMLATTLFSGKEAYYKAQFPITEAWVGFTDVEIRLDDHGSMTIHPASDLPALSRLSWPQPVRPIAHPHLAITVTTAHPV